MLIANPNAGDVIEGTGGLRKMRFSDSRRRKGKRGGLRNYWWFADLQLWLFTPCDKDELQDLTTDQRKALKVPLKTELDARRTT